MYPSIYHKSRDQAECTGPCIYTYNYLYVLNHAPPNHYYAQLPYKYCRTTSHSSTLCCAKLRECQPVVTGVAQFAGTTSSSSFLPCHRCSPTTISPTGHPSIPPGIYSSYPSSLPRVTCPFQTHTSLDQQGMPSPSQRYLEAHV